MTSKAWRKHCTEVKGLTIGDTGKNHTTMEPELHVFPMIFYVEDLATVNAEFYARGHIPNMIGAIDGTRFAFVPPRQNEHVFRNRKSLHSMNVQMVCLAGQYISHVNAKYPGLVRNTFVLRNSRIPNVMA
ncbi:hypothetical protein NDU88_007222 [Pleurodeles waltl]|uniref:DDE Tnp4 domain-containing protein n=1 Tax=Pleurodeles waltl TaxID=8319 RepID=A0AAV7U0M3_PLEWA|nr:hypothetical protein NDU88_007222 [Pleurodeles waltl]